jgi:pilus assembly protein Flp/PilA
MIWRTARRLRRVCASASQEAGVTAIEYALLASLIALVIFVAVWAVGTTLSGTYNRIGDEVTKAAGASP